MSLGRLVKRNPILSTVLVVWAIWLPAMVLGDYFSYFQKYWFMSVTMVFGSFIAGATSEGGGAVAFPVMTLLFKIKPLIARDFSLMIQTVGMGAAAFTIFCKKIPIEKRAILISASAGFFGIFLGLKISELLPPAYTKMFFASTWLSFAITLFIANRNSDLKRFDKIQHLNRYSGLLLVGAGLIGGITSGITGSGIDILTFSILVLFFKVCEKVATPTSVVIMALNAASGFFWKFAVLPSGISAEAWPYWLVCIPIVVLGAPFGAWFIKYRSRHFVIRVLYASILIQYVAALVIIDQTVTLLLFSIGLIVMGGVTFMVLEKFGEGYMKDKVVVDMTKGTIIPEPVKEGTV